MARFLACIAALLVSLPAVAAELYVAAAADLVYCLNDINAAFRKTHPNADIRVSTGSSGNFHKQIENGAPFDVFLSADLEYPQALVKAGKADGSTLFRYAVGRIALWTNNPKVDISTGVKILASPAIKRVAIANPAHAPYGKAAQSALVHERVWATVVPKLVMGDNIAQTALFVQTGNADAGIVALSLLKSPTLAGVGRYVLVPSNIYPRLEQGAVVTKKGQSNPLAKDYINFLRTSQARAIFDRYGFLLSAELVN